MFLFGIEDLLNGYEGILETIAHISVTTLELIGILIIIIGAVKSIVLNASKIFKKHEHNVRIALGQSLALGLEYKMGAEIIKTVLVRELQELIILAFIIALRAGLAVLIHWEIKLEKRESEENNLKIENKEK